MAEHWFEVRVAAPAIDWPPCCACCGGTSAATLQLTSTRVTGVKVLRSETHGWPVPYCLPCLDHLETSRRVAAPAGAEGPALSRPGPRAIHLPIAGALAGLCVGCLGGGLMMAAADRGPQADDAGFAVTSALAAVAVAAFLGWLWKRHPHQGVRGEEETPPALSEKCPAAGPAVRCEGWEGPVHTFLFANHDYAVAFMRANQAKLLT
jgi:hypothetical protein